MEIGWLAYNPYRINVGSIGIRKKEHLYQYISPAYVVFSCLDNLLPEYLYLLFRTERFIKIINESTTGSVRQNLTSEILKTLEIPLPSISEQETIVKNYYNKITQATTYEQQAETLEKNIENYLFESLGIEQKTEEKTKKKGLQFVEFGNLEKWGIDFILSNENIKHLFTMYKISDWTKHAIDTSKPGAIQKQDMIEFGRFAADLVKANPDNFRIFGPDETKSNRLNEVFKATNRQWVGRRDESYDEWISPVGRVIDSQLSEHQAEGFLEGYVLTGRHGFFASYESFLRVVDSMITQHFKWLRKAKTHAPWRKNYPSLNLIATSTVFQQDHNGYTHQDPGLLTHLAEKKPEFVREYLPADTNSLMAVMAEALSSEDKINLIVSSKHPRPQFYSVEEAKELVREGYKVIDWASTVKEGEEPDVVIAAAGTEPNLEALAGISILHKQFPELKIRFINVVDILKLRSPKVDPRGLSDEEFDKLFTADKPVVFCFHGYEGMIRDLFFDRNNHNVHIHGYRENGDITTPFDMRVLSEMDRFHVAKDAAVAVYGDKASEFAAKMDETVEFHHSYIREHGEDIPEVVSWQWENVNK